MDNLDALTSISLSLTTALSTQDKYNRLLEALSPAIPYDAAALLRLEKDELIPVAANGLSQSALGVRYRRKEHPRLDIICNSKKPVRFPPDSALPDPFDGLLINDKTPLGRVHDCLGCPLFVAETLVGILTADAMKADAFRHLDQRFLQAVSALAAAHMQTADLIEALEKNAQRQGLIARDLMRDIYQRQGEQIIGTSRVIEALKKEIGLVAKSDFTILITGETGVGKELVARAIHSASGRSQEPILYLNCAALPETLAESELFGHVRGAFTGANQDRAGKFELADGGTLFLDEIGELPMSIQAKLLRAIQEREIQRIGSNQTIHVDARLLAATNRRLDQEVKNGKFRADLFHRLHVYPLRVPPLRERAEDIPLLAGYFSDITRRKLGIGMIRFDPEALAILQTYAWPGNVRELENVISRAILKASVDSVPSETILITTAHIGKDLKQSAPEPDFSAAEPDQSGLKNQTLNEAVRNYKRQVIIRSVNSHSGNWAAAARDLGLHRSNLHHLAKKLGISR
ncbi:MAG: nitric oxide reductase transcriptional regulator NorR [Desulfobacteraceae bacterium]|nr:MAG: nitric oxide reductase transcriptional regulator NorR [Desulfobacteraceae bacterium]